MDHTDAQVKSSKFKRAATYTARAVIRTTLTLAVLAVAAVAVQYGSAELTRRAEAAPSPDPAPAIPVSVTPLSLQTGYDVQRAFIGQVEAAKTVSVSFELTGQLQSIRVDEGDTVSAGQVLATQDTSLLLAERRQLNASRSATMAQLTFAEQTVARNTELQSRGAVSQAMLDEAISRRDELTARIIEVDAGLANVDIRLAKSQVTAPFDGRVTSRQVDGGETLAAGQPILGLVELRAPQVRVGVPLDFDASTLENARIELDGQNINATLTSLRPDIDPVTRTRVAIFEISDDLTPAFGQTARLLVTERVEKDGFWVPITSLKEGVRGQWTLLTVDGESTVRAAQVELLHAEADRVFARAGFPDGTPLVDAGPQRVTVGQRVDVTPSR
ncbi:MAG: efflux RND transporter periplasmic adaptor subunit [Pseudomonadota bacterium]